ncbi:EF-hand domain-containing protein, partial [Escherichia coli]|nr:EF-hand domain-containing protein [Escherichia coli]
MKSIKKMIAAVVLCIVSAAASAQQMPPGAAAGGARAEHALMQLQTRFANANTTHDGKLTREQAAAGMPMVAQHF